MRDPRTGASSEVPALPADRPRKDGRKGQTVIRPPRPDLVPRSMGHACHLGPVLPKVLLSVRERRHRVASAQGNEKLSADTVGGF